MTLRLVSWNVRSLRDDRAAVARVLSGLAPDVVALQEAPRFLGWRANRAALARSAGLSVATSDRVGGLCLLVAPEVRVLERHHVALPHTRGRHRRALVAATLEVRGARWTAVSTHLSTDPAERVAHLPFLARALDAVRRDGALLVVAADVNDDPGSPAWTWLVERFVDVAASAGQPAPTSPSVGPRRRIDGVFADPAVRVLTAAVPSGRDVERGSDHRPVQVVLETGPASAAGE